MLKLLDVMFVVSFLSADNLIRTAPTKKIKLAIVNSNGALLAITFR